MRVFQSRPALHWLRHNRLIKCRTYTFIFLGVCTLAACDGAVQLCGDYACVYYQSSCESVNSCSEQKQCEAAGSIRDRAPRIINELRSAQRACTVNAQSENLSRLVWDATLASASESHSRDMAENRFESFDGTDGLSSIGRVEMVGFSAAELTESIGSGPQTAAEVINYWLDIETDCEHMLSSGTTRIGMACALSTESDKTPYWSLLLARPKNNGIRQ